MLKFWTGVLAGAAFMLMMALAIAADEDRDDDLP